MINCKSGWKIGLFDSFSRWSLYGFAQDPPKRLNKNFSEEKLKRVHEQKRLAAFLFKKAIFFRLLCLLLYQWKHPLIIVTENNKLAKAYFHDNILQHIK